LQCDITLLDACSCLLFGKVNGVPDQVGRAGAAQHKQLVFGLRTSLLRKVLQRTRRAIQYVEHSEGDGSEMFQAVK